MNTISVSFDINDHKKHFSVELDDKSHTLNNIKSILGSLSLAAVRLIERESIIANGDLTRRPQTKTGGTEALCGRVECSVKE